MVNRFREQRVKRNISVEKLSELSGISVEEIESIENAESEIGEISAIKTAYIAEAIGCLPSELIYRDRVM